MARLFRLMVLGCLLWGTAAGALAFDQEHAAWTRLLEKNVRWDTGGGATAVDYRALQAQRPALDAYLVELAAVPADEFARWPWPQRQAFLINAYNAGTVSLVLTGHPDIESIRDLGRGGTVDDQRFERLRGRGLRAQTIQAVGNVGRPVMGADANGDLHAAHIRCAC